MTETSTKEYKRTRITKSMRRRFEDCRSRIIGAWIDVEKKGLPINKIDYQELVGLYGPFAPSLSSHIWHVWRTCYDSTVRRCVRWALYLDGKPHTSDEISRKREGGDEDVWNRVAGRHNWEGRMNKPFYEMEPPKYLSGPKNGQFVKGWIEEEK